MVDDGDDAGEVGGGGLAGSVKEMAAAWGAARVRVEEA